MFESSAQRNACGSDEDSNTVLLFSIKLKENLPLTVTNVIFHTEMGVWFCYFARSGRDSVPNTASQCINSCCGSAPFTAGSIKVTMICK